MSEQSKPAQLLQQAIEAIQAQAAESDGKLDEIRKDIRADVDNALAIFRDNYKPETPESGLTVDKVREIFSESLSKAIDAIPPREINIDVAGRVQQMDSKHLHPRFEEVLTIAAQGFAPLLVGPAGSGKSTIANQVSEALGRKFYTQGPASSEYKYLGFTDAHGQTVRTPLRNAFEHGGVFCADEIDASAASALVSGLNMVLGNRTADFASDMVDKHDEFVCIATANTYGTGADRQYVGRNQIDASTLDRFIPVHIDYDETLERAIAQNDTWCDFVQSARKAAATLKIRCVISPRASIQGATLIRAGMARRRVADVTVWRSLDESTVSKVKAQMKSDKQENQS